MTEVRLSGTLRCATAAESELVARCLPTHMTLARDYTVSGLDA